MSEQQPKPRFVQLTLPGLAKVEWEMNDPPVVDPPPEVRIVRLAPVEEATEEEAPPKASEDAAKDILRLYYQEQRRFTLEETVEALENSREAYAWCRSTVAATCRMLRSQGLVTNKRDARGNGYGLTNWTTNPVGDD
jgi:hypothetical protein